MSARQRQGPEEQGGGDASTAEHHGAHPLAGSPRRHPLVLFLHPVSLQSLGHAGSPDLRRQLEIPDLHRPGTNSRCGFSFEFVNRSSPCRRWGLWGLRGQGGGRFDEWALPVPPLNRQHVDFTVRCSVTCVPGCCLRPPPVVVDPAPPDTHAHESAQRVPSDCALSEPETVMKTTNTSQIRLASIYMI